VDPLAVPDHPADNDLAILGLSDRKWGVFRAGTGLWLLQECIRLWHGRGIAASFEQLSEEAAAIPGLGVIDPSDPRFDAPQEMLSELGAACRDAGSREPRTPGEFARLIFDSLAEHYAGAAKSLQQATRTDANCLRVLGGGSRNKLLCQMIADAARLTVLAGPAEAAAIGNILNQAKATGLIGSDRETEAVLQASFALTPCEPGS
jgi:rhamnulokinase